MAVRDIALEAQNRGWLRSDAQRPFNAIYMAALRMATNPREPVERVGRGVYALYRPDQET